jgi:hypothetical protein
VAFLVPLRLYSRARVGRESRGLSLREVGELAVIGKGRVKRKEGRDTVKKIGLGCIVNVLLIVRGRNLY